MTNKLEYRILISKKDAKKIGRYTKAAGLVRIGLESKDVSWGDTVELYSPPFLKATVEVSSVLFTLRGTKKEFDDFWEKAIDNAS